MEMRTLKTVYSDGRGTVVSERPDSLLLTYNNPYCTVISVFFYDAEVYEAYNTVSFEQELAYQGVLDRAIEHAKAVLFESGDKLMSLLAFADYVGITFQGSLEDCINASEPRITKLSPWSMVGFANPNVSHFASDDFIKLTHRDFVCKRFAAEDEQYRLFFSLPQNCYKDGVPLIHGTHFTAETESVLAALKHWSVLDSIRQRVKRVTKDRVFARHVATQALLVLSKLAYYGIVDFDDDDLFSILHHHVVVYGRIFSIRMDPIDYKGFPFDAIPKDTILACALLMKN